MSNIERIQKYIKEYCSNCKNKDTDLCDIRVLRAQDIIYTKCCYYERIIDYESCLKKKCKICKYQEECFKRKGRRKDES